MFHSRPIDWEVVDSYSVAPVRVYVEDDGAAIVRLAPHEIVGDYTFDMAPPARNARSAPTPHATRKSGEGSSGRPRSCCPRRASAHLDKNHSSRSALAQRDSDPQPSRSLDRDFHIPRSTAPERIADSNENCPNAAIPEGASPNSKRLSLALSCLKSNRRSSSSSAESSSGASDAGTSDGESEPPVVIPSRSPRFSQHGARVKPTSSHATGRPAVEVPTYKKSDLKRALIFARYELMKQVEASGKNALVLEGWTVTVLRQGSRYRIQVEYTGRPAIVNYPDGAPASRVPPFLEIVDQ